jgi:dTDP-4-amino-4,6-dideoxygalactose transaminase
MSKRNIPRETLPILIPQAPNYRKLRRYLRQIDKKKRYSNFGPLNGLLIERLAQYLQQPESNVQTAANATLAIQGAIATSEVSTKIWEMPSWTFAATAHGALNAGATVRLVDVSENTWRAKFTGGTENLLDVLPFGDNFDFERIQMTDGTIVVDAAASIMALKNCSLNNRNRIGVVISLHATKLLPAGEGAVFFTNCTEWASRFKKWTNYAFDSDRDSRFIATNAKLSEYSAAVALASLDEFADVRLSLESKMNKAKAVSSKFSFDIHPAMKSGFVTPYWIIRMKNSTMKSDVISRFKDNRIEVRDWWGAGCHKHQAFKHLKHESMKNTHELSSTTIGLPFHNFLKSSDFARISETLNECSLA